MTRYNVNRFFILAAIAWQFNVFLGTQGIFAIFSNYVPRWRCSANESFARNCDVFVSCPEAVQFENHDFYSAALEFGWICGPSRHLLALQSQANYVGILLGTLLFGHLPDVYGRKPVSVGTLTLGIVAVAVSGFATDWRLLLISRFMVGFVASRTTFILVMEMILPEQRILLRGFANWGIARMMLTFVCFMFPNWRHASIASAVAIAPALLIVLYAFPESPTWLRQKGKLDDARRSDAKIVRMGGVATTDGQDGQHTSYHHTSSFLSLLRNPVFLRRLGVLWTMFFTASIAAYANDLNSSSLSGNLFLNQLLFGVLIALSKIMLVVMDASLPNFTRRNLHNFSQLSVCICFALLAILVAVEANPWIILAVNLLGTMCIEFVWDACSLCAVESFPTEVRSRAVAVCFLVARVAAIFSPYLIHLNVYWEPSAYVLVTLVGLVNLSVAYMWLEETKDVSLAQVGLGAEVKQDAVAEQETMLAKPS
ncbi:Protein K11D9.3 [Aphelenchoides avenae]|nr:Protein K11D9.3 [Aphelenchus avenae]